jgi:hypothetical protein
MSTRRLASLKAALSDSDRLLLQQADKHFMQNGPLLTFSDLQFPNGMSEYDVYLAFYRFGQFGLCKCESLHLCTLNSTLPQFVYELNKPPPPTYWESLLEWWYSRKWAVAFVLIFVALGLINQVIGMLQKAIEWFIPLFE